MPFSPAEKGYRFFGRRIRARLLFWGGEERAKDLLLSSCYQEDAITES